MASVCTGFILLHMEYSVVRTKRGKTSKTSWGLCSSRLRQFTSGNKQVSGSRRYIYVSPRTEYEFLSWLLHQPLEVVFQNTCFPVHCLCMKYSHGFIIPLIVRFMGSTWGPSGADRTQVGPMLATWTLFYGYTLLCNIDHPNWFVWHIYPYSSGFLHWNVVSRAREVTLKHTNKSVNQL